MQRIVLSSPGRRSELCDPPRQLATDFVRRAGKVALRGVERHPALIAALGTVPAQALDLNGYLAAAILPTARAWLEAAKVSRLPLERSLTKTDAGLVLRWSVVEDSHELGSLRAASRNHKRPILTNRVNSLRAQPVQGSRLISAVLDSLFGFLKTGKQMPDTFSVLMLRLPWGPQELVCERGRPLTKQERVLLFGNRASLGDNFQWPFNILFSGTQNIQDLARGQGQRTGSTFHQDVGHLANLLRQDPGLTAVMGSVRGELDRLIGACDTC